jgi:hypothetical protein
MAEGFFALFAETDLPASTNENKKYSFQDEMIETFTPREGEILGMFGDGAKIGIEILIFDNSIVLSN